MTNEIPASTMKQLRSVLTRWAILLILIGVFFLWATWRMTRVAANANAVAARAHESPMPAQPVVEYWTCTMHPDVHQSTPGKCPICAMPLVEKYKGSDQPGAKPETLRATATHPSADRNMQGDQSKEWYRCTMTECGDQGSADPNSRCPVCGMKRERIESVAMDGDSDVEIKLSQRAIRLAEIATETVESRMLNKRLRTVGRVGYDETRYKMVSAWIGGRIDKLYADFTGMTVKKGDHLVEIYSPELLSAQEEYLQAVLAARSLQGSQTAVARRSAEQVQSSARRKLELLGITSEQIAEIESSGKPQTHLVIHAPIGGTILKSRRWKACTFPRATRSTPSQTSPTFGCLWTCTSRICPGSNHFKKFASQLGRCLATCSPEKSFSLTRALIRKHVRCRCAFMWTTGRCASNRTCGLRLKSMRD
ncbi:MAG: efflux RND transporter periplasmic adaptor subunit [Phycisphaerae bacterium]